MTSAPDISRLLSHGDQGYRALGRRLIEIGLTHEVIARLEAPLERVPPTQRKALRLFHLRRDPTPVARALRMLAHGDPVPRAEADELLAATLLDELLAVGFVIASRGGDGEEVVSPFVLTLHGDRFVVVDPPAHGGSAVLSLSRVAVPIAKVARGLAVGRASSAHALALSPQVEQVVALHEGPRTLTLAKIDAAINGVSNIEHRHRGDGLSDPLITLSESSFDVVVAHPSIHETEGRVDDPLLLLSRASRLLAPGGLCLMYVDWPEAASAQSFEERARLAQPSHDFDLLLLRAAAISADLHAGNEAFADHPSIDDTFARAVVERRRQLERLGADTVRPTLLVVRRVNDGRQGWSATLELRALDTLVPSRLRIERFLAAQDVLHAGDRAIVATALRFPKRTTFVGERNEPNPNLEPDLSARFSERALVVPFALDRQSFLLLSLVHMSETVEEAMRFMARTWSISIDDASARLLPHVKRALAAGAMEVAPKLA